MIAVRAPRATYARPWEAVVANEQQARQAILAWAEGVDAASQQTALAMTANAGQPGLGEQLVDGFEDWVNDGLSFGQALLDNPGLAVGLIGGTALFALGAGATGGGTVVSGTGVGAVAGVPAAALGIGMMGTGGATAAVSWAQLMAEADGASRVEPFQVNGILDKLFGKDDDPNTGDHQQDSGNAWDRGWQNSKDGFIHPDKHTPGLFPGPHREKYPKKDG
jgi:hypothetical protein